eukprot:Rmarinus@m.24567
MAKYAEKLLVLNEVCEGLLCRVHTLAAAVGSFPFLTDPAYKKVNTFLTKNFPDTPDGLDGVQGSELLKPPKGNEIYHILEPHFFTLVDAMEFKDEALATIMDIGQNTMKLSFDHNRNVLVQFLRLFTGYCRLHQLLTSVPDRKTICAVYARVKLLAHGTAEQNYSKVGNYLKEFDNVWKKLQEEFAPLSKTIGETIMGLNLHFHNTIDPDQLRKRGCLDLFNTEQITLPVNDKLHQELYHAQDYYVWILYGFMACPRQLYEPGAIDLLKATLKECYCMPIWREISFDIHGEYKTLFSTYSIKDARNKDMRLNKQDKHLKEATKLVVEETGKLHRARRTYLKLEMGNMLNFLADQPGVLAPKLQMVLTALHLARDEVIWLVRHMNTPPPKIKSQHDPRDYEPHDIPQLIYLVERLSALVRKYKDYIQDYYQEYLAGPHLRHLSPLIEEALTYGLDKGVCTLLNAIRDSLSSGSRNYKALRLDWARAQALFSSTQSTVSLGKLDQLNRLMNLIVFHTTHVDELEMELNECSLKLLYWFRPQVDAIFKNCLDGAERVPMYCMAFASLHDSFLLNAHRMHPAEQPSIMENVLKNGEHAIFSICDKVRLLLYNLCLEKAYGKLDNQIAPRTAGVRWAMEVEGRGKEPLPGHESNLGEQITNEYTTLFAYDRTLPLLLSAIEETNEIRIANTVYCPREFLREILRQGLKETLNWVSMKEKSQSLEYTQSSLNRPTVMLNMLLLYIRCLKIVENYVSIDVMALVESVLREDIFDGEHVGHLSTVKVFEDMSKELPNKTIAHKYANFYRDLVWNIEKRNPKLIWSPVRKAFVLAEPGGTFRCEDFTDYGELVALARVIGPFGIRCIDIQLLRVVRILVGKIKEQLLVNRTTAEEMLRAMSAHGNLIAVCGKLKGLDEVFSLLVTIGMTLALRMNLHEALSSVMKEDSPFIFSALNMAGRNFKHRMPVRNHAQEMEPMLRLLHEAGAVGERADGDLRHVLSSYGNQPADAQLWESAPFLFASVFLSKKWMDCEYKSAPKAFSNNGHAAMLASLVIMESMSQVCHDAAYNSAISAGTQPKETKLGESVAAANLRRFAEVAATLLIQIRNQELNRIPKWYPYNVVFLDKLVEYSTEIPRCVVEPLFPYAFTRVIYVQIYESQRKKGDAKMEDLDYGYDGTGEAGGGAA